MVKQFNRNQARRHRHVRVRSKISGTPERPRLCVYRSNQNIYAQIIDDVSGHTLIAANSLEKEIAEQFPKAGGVEAAKAVGERLAQKALEKGIEEVVFDRGGYLYHGRVKNLAEGAREKGLKF